VSGAEDLWIDAHEAIRASMEAGYRLFGSDLRAYVADESAVLGKPEILRPEPRLIGYLWEGCEDALWVEQAPPIEGMLPIELYRRVPVNQPRCQEAMASRWQGGVPKVEGEDGEQVPREIDEISAGLDRQLFHGPAAEPEPEPEPEEEDEPGDRVPLARAILRCQECGCTALTPVNEPTCPGCKGPSTTLSPTSHGTLDTARQFAAASQERYMGGWIQCAVCLGGIQGPAEVRVSGPVIAHDTCVLAVLGADAVRPAIAPRTCEACGTEPATLAYIRAPRSSPEAPMSVCVKCNGKPEVRLRRRKTVDL